ncbi:MAG TPA: FAD-binding oxidoreductase [Chloroflexota bacterium]|nr:FAD-binding oxidoreductase [Chloroflexota bacterium]
MAGTDIVIVGGGCMGASIAYHLALAGAGDITLLERGTLGSGTTGASSAIIRQHYGIPTLAAMAQRSLRIFQHFDELVGGEVGFRQTGLLIGARAEDFEAIGGAVAMQRDLGIDTRMVDRAELRALEPRMVIDDLVGACHEPEAGYADPVATTMAYSRAARAAGARIRENTPVEALLVEDGVARGVRLAGGAVLRASTVIVAANIWSVPLLRQVGIDLPVHGTRHPCLLLRQPADFGPQHAIFFDFTNGLYLKPEGANLTLAGTLDESEALAADPTRVPSGPTHEEAERFATRASRRFPALEQATLQSGYAGLYDVSEDWQPIIGPMLGISGLFGALGFSGHGFKLCPVVGELVADMVLGRETPGIDRDLFRADRFATGQLAPSRYTYNIIG